MHINMDDSRVVNLTQLKAFLEGAKKFDLSLRDGTIDEKYQFIDEVVERFDYQNLKKEDKHLVIRYLRKITGYKKAQLYRLVKRAGEGKLKHKKYRRKNPNRKYSSSDVKLLEKTDELHWRLNSIATREILRREYEVFGHEKFANISEVSPSHVNNLRKSLVYLNSYLNHTKARKIAIGTTQIPENLGRPGSIKVDSVSQKDMFHINSVDEMTQWEVVVGVPQITEEYMNWALGELLEQFPFWIFNFHSDRGGENINYTVARTLQKLLIKQAKTRARHPTDNALVETKNGHVIRKNMGWHYIHQDLVDEYNQHYRELFNPYLNYHRPSLFATHEVKYPNGRTRKIYDQAMVPYEKLKEVSNEKKQTFLKPGLTFEELDKIAYKESDNEFAKKVRQAERKILVKVLKHQGSR